MHAPKNVEKVFTMKILKINKSSEQLLTYLCTVRLVLEVKQLQQGHTDDTSIERDIIICVDGCRYDEEAKDALSEKDHDDLPESMDTNWISRQQ